MTKFTDHLRRDRQTTEICIFVLDLALDVVLGVVHDIFVCSIADWGIGDVVFVWLTCQVYNVDIRSLGGSYALPCTLGEV